jgi:hypothetical protein
MVFAVFGLCLILLEKVTYYQGIEVLNRELPFEEQVRPYSLMNLWRNVRLSVRFGLTPTGRVYRNRILRIRILYALSFGIALLFFWLARRR